MREEIVEKLRENADTSVFLQAQHQVYNLMHRDSYPRFLTSPFLAKIVSELSSTSNADIIRTQLTFLVYTCPNKIFSKKRFKM